MSKVENRYNLEVCTVCGEVFSTEYRAGWGWRDVDGKKVCSYTCQRKSETAGKKNPQRKRIAVKVVETGETYASMSECAGALGICYKTVYEGIHNGKDIKGMHLVEVK